jgi:hypothetical protein
MSGSRSYWVKRFHALTQWYFWKLVHTSFLARSVGKEDDVGQRWKPLSRKTIAYRPDNNGKRIAGTGGKGLLSVQEAARWRSIYRSQIQRGASPAEAGSIAWGILKSQGAKTKIGTLGSRKVPIHIRSKRLLRSVTPEAVSGTKYIAGPDQISRVVPGRDGKAKFTYGTRVPYAGRLDQMRPIFGKGPQEWLQEAAMKAREQIRQEIASDTRRQR